MADNKYSDLWKKVDSLKNIGQMKTALALVNSIYENSKSGNLPDQTVKALLYRIGLETSFEEENEEKAIAFLSEELKVSSPPLKQILYSVLAEVYRNYYERNRWIISDRIAVPEDTASDISVWDVKRFMQTCSEFYTLSVSEASLLKSTPLSKYVSILEGEKDSRRFRPTLYDFLAFRAIGFFTGESRFPQSSTFDSSAGNPGLFAPANDFIKMEFATDNPSSFESRALNIYREVISFHLKEQPDITALIDADLARLAFVYRISTHAEKGELYLKALKYLSEQYLENPVSAEINYQLALQLKTQGSLYEPAKTDRHKWEIKEALELAEKTFTRFPETDGGKNCHALSLEIRLPHLVITGNQAVIPGLPSLALTEFRNVEKLYGRVVKVTWEPGKDQQYKDTKDRIKEYRKIKPVEQWNVNLPSEGDFQIHRAEIKIPVLPVGQYVLLTSINPRFDVDSLISFLPFQCSAISVINRRSGGQTEFVVLHRKEGQPLAGIKVQKYYREYDYNKRRNVTRSGESGTTDENGFVRFNPPEPDRRGTYFLVLKNGKDQFISEDFYFWERGFIEQNPVVKTWLFADRAIYRPGQTVFYKGIVTKKNGIQIDVQPGFRTVIRFKDVNGQEISRREMLTNEFGSYSGSFTIPAGGLTGSFTIDDGHGQITVQVEEYKRPKFETLFNPVKGSYKLGEQVIISGKAVAYAGFPVSDATVTFRVKRNARFPWFWRWGPEIPLVSEKEIVQGKTTTNSQGEFTIIFEAVPDLTVPKDKLPVFDYSVQVDVSDINGETHSAQTMVSVGYKALLVNTGLADEEDGSSQMRFTLATTNLNGQPEKASGDISIYRIRIPENFLFPRKWKKPDLFTMTRSEFKKFFPEEIYDNEDDITTWEKGEKMLERSFSTPGDSLIEVSDKPAPGLYVLEIKTKDSYGEEVEYKKYFTVYTPGSSRNPTHTSLMFKLMKNVAEPGESVQAILATPLRNIRAIMEFISVEGNPKRMFYRLDNRQISVDIPVYEENRGNLSLHLFFVRNNRLFQEHRMIRVPYTNKELNMTLGSFRDKLHPGQEEEWTITIRDKKGNKALAEVMAGMYDASLDAFLVRPWNFSLYPFYPEYITWNADKGFGTGDASAWWYPSYPGPVPREYERLLNFGFSGFYGNRRFMIRGLQPAPEAAMAMDVQAEAPDEKVFAIAEEMPEFSGGNARMKKGETPSVPVSIPPSKPRTDLRETAFFLPHLITNENGETILKFKMPESLTRWQFRGLAHTKDLKTGMIEKSLVTQKDLMVFPNAPRFLREDDRMQFTVKISNLSGASMTGTAELHFFDAFTMKPVDDRMENLTASKNFTAGEGGSAVVGWKIVVPEGLQAVVYRITATSGSFSDGEEAALPVLTNRMLVTESLPLPVRANTSKTFTFKKLSESGQSKTLKNYRLTLEYTSHPAWYAVQALPYLMEFPYECTEQLFSRYYANTLAGYIANSDPAINRVFETWKSITPAALKSNLEKNGELKSVLLEETPWVRQATNENERKQRIGMLFDLNRMAAEQNSALKKLADSQTVNGGWPWFPGMPESFYITRHIVTGLGHLIHLNAMGLNNDPKVTGLIEKAIGFLDAGQLKEFREMKKRDPGYLKNNHLHEGVVQYFYARSFFLESFPFDTSLDTMINYYKSQAIQYWTGLNNYLKGMTALFLNRMYDRKTALLILRSLGETALRSDELGMYWKKQPGGWFWYQAPIESQAMLIEAFDEVAGDLKSVDELKVWLLKQKQTQDWNTTKATTEAVYALLLRGTSFLSSGEQVKVTVGNQQVNPYLSSQVKPEPGTGYFKTSWEAAEISPEKGKVKVENPNNTIAWGALYWQYFEQLDKITKAESPLKTDKNLFVEVNTPTGPVLEAITTERSIKVGDKVVVRVILRSDRDMEYIHLKDMRASAFEPLNVLSGYRWQGGLGYYESTRDAATNFFIDYLPKGTYVFEYKLFATQKGEFSNGITSVQCMYAPEFSAHTEGIRVKVE